ncbi:hypothetical protein QJS04_geneDACA021770 [Acorus gramineus]|uniref:Uncharacterized protein n=1 Tax=Acorus gramineus TaxID=55184 RepID=A0AAV9A491_ACOGR|nr:hypothetical protein QJS04_geneDACA021770 [Acorus gramineus]
MAVQAQYPSNAFAADFRTRARNNLLEEFQFQFQIQNQTPTRNLFTAYNNLGAPQPQQILNGTVFSDPESELTCIASGTRKRSRDDQDAMAMTPQQQCLRYANLNKTVGAAAGNDISYDQSRMSESGTTSTSGRPPAHASPFTQDLASHLYQQNLEIDALIRLQVLLLLL